MDRLSPPHSKPVPNPLSLFAQTVTNHNSHNFPSTSCFFPWRIGPLTHKKNPLHTFPPPSKSLFTLNCTSKRIGDDILSTSSAYEVLGVVPNCSPTELKAAFRTKVKQYHPDVRKAGELSHAMIRCVIQAYQVIWDPYQSCKDVHPCHPVTFYHGCLKYLEVVESYHPDRVLRQFGRVQTIPNPPLGPMRASRGAIAPCYNVMYAYLDIIWEAWNNHVLSDRRRSTPVRKPWDCVPSYMDWYQTITYMYVQNPERRSQVDPNIHHYQYPSQDAQIYQITHPFVEAGYENSVQHPDRLYYAIDATEQLLQDQHISEATPSTSTQGQSATSSSNAHRFGAHYTRRSRS